MVLSGIPGFRQVSVIPPTTDAGMEVIQFIIWSFMWSRPQLAASLCISSDVEIDADMVVLAYVVRIITGVDPLHLLLDVFYDVYIWKSQLARCQQEGNVQSGKLTISPSRWVIHIVICCHILFVII